LNNWTAIYSSAYEVLYFQGLLFVTASGPILGLASLLYSVYLGLLPRG